MAFDATYLVNLTGMAPGRSIYRYDTTDQMDAVGAAGYMNNADDNLNLGVGDIIHAQTWSATPYASGSTLSEAKDFIVSNVIANDAASSAGAVNLAERQPTGSISSNV